MKFPLLAAMATLLSFGPLAFADETAPERRRREAIEFHLRAQERTGLLVPMYVYPANIHTNEAYNRLIDAKRRHETVPMWVVLNPASGPGDAVDANYVKAIDRLRGAGCVTIGYVSTAYGKRAAAEVAADVDKWLKMYPKIQGIFFDEMIYEDTDAAVAHQTKLTQHARDVGCWPIIANPGADTPERYFAANAADVIVIHEGAEWPKEERIHGDYFGGYSDYPPFTRAVLLYSQKKFDATKLKMVRKHARWFYATEDDYRPNDPTAPNPWDRLTKFLEETCVELEK